MLLRIPSLQKSETGKHEDLAGGGGGSTWRQREETRCPWELKRGTREGEAASLEPG